jgi:hypothetical protein
MNQLAPAPAPAPASAPLADFYRRSASPSPCYLKRFEFQSQDAGSCVGYAPSTARSAKDHDEHGARSTERGQGRLPACAPGRGGQEGETQTPKGARKKRTGRRVAVPEELSRRHRVVGWQQLLIKLMHFHSSTAPAAPTTRPTNRSPPTQTLSTRIRTKTAASNGATQFYAIPRPQPQPPTAIPRLFHDHLTTQNITHMHTKRQAQRRY